MQTTFRPMPAGLLGLSFVLALFVASCAIPTDAASKAPPPMGWSSWSSLEGKIDEKTIKAEADVMASRLKSFGYRYINLDAGWAPTRDEHGLPVADAVKFPGGIPALAAYVHAKGLKFGVYLQPGLEVSVWKANGTVAGTDIHFQEIADTAQAGNTEGKDGAAFRIDYMKPGGKEYLQSFANLLAGWGVDYIKMDFVGPGGGNVKADNREDIKQWHEAIRKTGRPMWLELSNSLDFGSVDTWRTYANGWRIDGDIESYNPSGLTNWGNVKSRFDDAPKWAPDAGPGAWNDLDSLELGNGDADGLTPDERRTAMTLWAVSCSPLIIGADLTKLDDSDSALLTNTEVIAVDQAGHVATPLFQTPQVSPGKNPSGSLASGLSVLSELQVWRVKNPDGSFTVALFDLSDSEALVSLRWSDLGFSGPASVRDLWRHDDLGAYDSGYQATLAAHACQLLRVKPGKG